jgi:hypothetical protein
MRVCAVVVALVALTGCHKGPIQPDIVQRPLIIESPSDTGWSLLTPPLTAEPQAKVRGLTVVGDLPVIVVPSDELPGPKTIVRLGPGVWIPDREFVKRPPPGNEDREFAMKPPPGNEDKAFVYGPPPAEWMRAIQDPLGSKNGTITVIRRPKPQQSPEVEAK